MTALEKSKPVDLLTFGPTAVPRARSTSTKSRWVQDPLGFLEEQKARGVRFIQAYVVDEDTQRFQTIAYREHEDLYRDEVEFNKSVFRFDTPQELLEMAKRGKVPKGFDPVAHQVTAAVRLLKRPKTVCLHDLGSPGDLEAELLKHARASTV